MGVAVPFRWRAMLEEELLGRHVALHRSPIERCGHVLTEDITGAANTVEKGRAFGNRRSDGG